MTQRNITRRGFVQSSAGLAAASMLPRATRAAEGSPNEQIRIAVIGLNSRGMSHVQGFQDHLVAMCDCDEKVLNQKADEFERRTNRKIHREVDFRRLLERGDIDAVSIATPNHTHSLISVLAAQAGKDIYVEKPVSQCVWEGRQIVNAADKYNRIIQTGTQSRSSPSLHKAHEYIHSGKLGKILYAIGTCYKPRKSIGKLDEPLKIPANIDYNLWCGPVEMVDLYRPKLHYDWHWDFHTGNGDMGNQGIHQMDIARWFTGHDTVSPKVISIGGRVGYDDAGNTPNTQTVMHAYAERPIVFETRGLPKAKQFQKKGWGDNMDRYRGSKIGVIVQCEDGHVLIPSYTEAIIYDGDGNEIEHFSGSGEHFDNFLAAVHDRDRGKLNADILEGHLSSALCHTGGVSHLVGEKRPAKDIAGEISGNDLLADSFDRMAHHLRENEIDISGPVLTLGPWLEMNTKSENFVGNPDAQALVRRDDRPPFVVPEITATV